MEVVQDLYLYFVELGTRTSDGLICPTDQLDRDMADPRVPLDLYSLMYILNSGQRSDVSLSSSDDKHHARHTLSVPVGVVHGYPSSRSHVISRPFPRCQLYLHIFLAFAPTHRKFSHSPAINYFSVKVIFNLLYGSFFASLSALSTLPTQYSCVCSNFPLTASFSILKEILLQYYSRISPVVALVLRNTPRPALVQSSAIQRRRSYLGPRELGLDKIGQRLVFVDNRLIAPAYEFAERHINFSLTNARR